MKLGKSNNGTRRFVLCVHIGASSRHAAILDESGAVLVKDEKLEPPNTRRNRDYMDLLSDAVGALKSLIEQAAQQGMDTKTILGGGAIVPGSVNPDTGYVGLLPALPGLRNSYLAHDLAEAIAGVLGRPIVFWVENDANGAGLSELRFGNGREVRHLLVLIVCTGLGGALVLNGVLYHGHTWRAGEIGHTTVMPDGPLCPCGGKGCLETLASGGAILRAVHHSDSSLKNRENLSYREVIEAAEAGDQEVIAIFRRMGHYLGIGISNLVNTLNPAKVILCGQLTKAATLFLPEVEEEMSHRVFQGMDCELAVSGCLEDMEVRAALSTFLNYSEQRT